MSAASVRSNGPYELCCCTLTCSQKLLGKMERSFLGMLLCGFVVDPKFNDCQSQLCNLIG